MPPKADTSTYYVKRKGPETFEVAKFKDGDQPDKLYQVTLRANGTGKCDCPAYSFRRIGMSDKHIRLIQKWIAGGEKVQAISDLEAFLNG